MFPQPARRLLTTVKDSAAIAVRQVTDLFCQQGQLWVDPVNIKIKCLYEVFFLDVSDNIFHDVVITKDNVSLASSFIDKDICTIAEKQNAENATKKTSAFLLVSVAFDKPFKKG